MAQPPLEVKTDSGKGAATDKPPVNPLFVQIADDLPQQFRTFNKASGTSADSPSSNPSQKAEALPGMTLFDGSRNGASTVDNKTEPAHDYLRERNLLFRGNSTIRCHDNNSNRSGFDYKTDPHMFDHLKPNNRDNRSNQELLERILHPENTNRTRMSDAEVQRVLDYLNDPRRGPVPKLETAPQTLPQPEIKVEPKTEPKTEPKQEGKPEAKVEPKLEPKAEPKEEEKPEVPKVEEKPLTAFEQSIKDTGAYTVENISAAYAKAGKEKDGVALVIVGENTPGSKELLEKLPQLQAQHPELTFVVVNKDKLDERLSKNPEDSQAKTWKAWVDQNLKDCSGQPIDHTFTSVQTLKADESGKPIPERVTSTHWGADIEASLADQSKFAAAGTAKNSGDFKIEPAKPEGPIKPEGHAKLEEALKPIPVFRPKNPEEALAFIEATKPKLYGKETTEEGQKQREEKYLQAIAVADKVNPEYLSKQKIKVQAEIEKEVLAAKAAASATSPSDRPVNKPTDSATSPSDKPVEKSKLDGLNKQLRDLEALEKAPALLRAEMGVDLLWRANNEKNVEKQAAMKTLALEILRNAFKADPELAKEDTVDFHIFNQNADTAKLAQEASASTMLSADQINQQLKSIAKIGVPIPVQVPTEKAQVEKAANSDAPIVTTHSRETLKASDSPDHIQRELPKTTSGPKIERSVSSSCSGEVRACNAAKQSNCQSFCQSPRQSNNGCQSRRPILNFLRRCR